MLLHRFRHEERVDGKSIMGIMMLAAESGTTLELEAEGPDCQDQLRALILDPKTPDFWNTTFETTDAPSLATTPVDVDAAVAKAKSLGATVLAPPFDVMDAGRMAVLQDPTGAVFQVWQAKKHIGAMILSEPGALCWTELTTTDTKAAEKFYTQLFGWVPKHSPPESPMEYTEFSVDGVPSIGMMAKPPQMPASVPSNWMPYFQVSDIVASVAKAKAEGGRLIVGPQEIPGGGLLRGAHLLQSQARLDEVAAAEIIPAAPFRSIPGERRRLPFFRLEARKELPCACEKVGRGAKPFVGRPRGGVGYGGRDNQSGPCDDDATTIGLCRGIIGF